MASPTRLFRSLLALALAVLTWPGAGAAALPPAAASLPTRPAADFVWPEWARTARLAGAYFAADSTDAQIDGQLAGLAAQRVSVVVADTPLGERYSAWVDDAEFAAAESLASRVVERARARGLRVVLYLTGLELVSPAGRNPLAERPEWAQRSIGGVPVAFDDIPRTQQHWLDRGLWDFWVSPCSGFRELAQARVRRLAATGADGLWVDQAYLQQSTGDHTELWPSHDACSVAAFRAATGLALPREADWEDPTWRRWILWRHAQIDDYLLGLRDAARGVNPAIVFVVENSGADTGRPTNVANDPARLLAHPDMATAHEVETVGDRVDLGERGMLDASPDDWLALRTMVAFARGADRGKPSWILTYGYRAKDSARLAGLALAEGANFYETRGPAMADSVGEAHRTALFGWMADHEAALGGESAAEVALIYSPLNRDLLDEGAGEPYDAEESTHFAAYRAAANALYRAQVPFDVVLDTDLAAFDRYRTLILPRVELMSDETAAALLRTPGRLLGVGVPGRAGPDLVRRSAPALAAREVTRFAAADAALAAAADTGLLAAPAPESVQLGLRRTAAGYSVVVVNTAGYPNLSPAVGLTLRLRPGETVRAAALAAFDAPSPLPAAVTFVQTGDTVRVELPAGVETVGLLTLTTG